MEEQLFLAVPARLARQVLALADAQGRIALSQAELAQRLGVSREMVSRQLSLWRAAGFVELGRGRIAVRDHAAIEALAAGG